MKLFSKRRDEKLVGIIDIGNGSVGVSLVRLNSAGIPEILSGGRKELPVPDTRSGDLLFSQVLKELPATFKALSGSPEHLLFIISSPWIRVSSIRTLRFSRATPFLVTESLLERMLLDEARLSKSQEEEGYAPIERTIVGLRLNGYSVTTLPSSPVQTAEVTFFTSAIPRDELQSLTDAASSSFPHVPVSFHSAPLSAYYGLARLFPSTLSHIFINITGEVTELLHVENGTPSAFGTFPIGRNTLLRTLQAAGMPPHEALSALELVREESPMRQKLGETLAYAQLEWRKGLREALSALLPTGGFPQSFFVAADIRAAAWFGDAVRGEEFLTVSRGSPPTVDVLSLAEFSSEIHLSGGTADPLVLLAALFADARFDEGRTIDLLSTKNPAGMPVRATLNA